MRKRLQTWARESGQILREPRMQSPPAGSARPSPTSGNASYRPLATAPSPARSASSLPAPPGYGSHAHRSSSTTCSNSTRTPCTPPSSSFTATRDPCANPLPPEICASRDWPPEGHVALSSLGTRRGMAADGWDEGPRHMTGGGTATNENAGRGHVRGGASGSSGGWFRPSGPASHSNRRRGRATPAPRLSSRPSAGSASSSAAARHLGLARVF